ncbi:Protein F44G4.2 [Aphelenchoides besseyi]|nr:Protein F44G4.2 [Aphelenchoides besseyi]
MLGRKLVDVQRLRLAHRILRETGVLNQFAATRSLHLTATQRKWLSAEEAKLVAEIPVGPKPGHPEDPVRNTYDKEYRGSPNKGDVLIKEWHYRSYPTSTTYLDRVITLLLTTMFWYWLAYHMYWDYKIYTGHFYMPYLEEFTDEELGIPPDSAEDPEYWGHHGKPYGTYR